MTSGATGAPWEQPHHDAGPAASRTLALLVLRKEGEGEARDFASLVSDGTSLRSSRWDFASLVLRDGDSGGGRAQSRFKDRQMRSQIQESADAQSDPSACMRETHEGPSQTCCGYLLTPLADTTHLRRLRLGDLSRWVRRGCSGRAEAKAQASSPRPTRSGTSRYKKKRGSTPSNLTSARLPITVFAKHHGAPWRSAGGVIRQCGSRRRCPGPSQIAPAIWRAPGGERFRAQALRARECSPQGGRPHVHRDQSNEPHEGRPHVHRDHREGKRDRRARRNVDRTSVVVVVVVVARVVRGGRGAATAAMGQRPSAAATGMP